jgi:hypothetical protein
MRVLTQVHFDVVSDVLSPEELEARIGMAPSSVMRKASKHLDQPVEQRQQHPEMVPATLPIPPLKPSSHHETEFPNGTRWPG